MGDRATERLIRVTVSPDLVDLVSDRMWQWGVRGVTESTDADGRVVLTTSVGDDDEAIAAAVDALDPSWQCTIEEVDATPAETWRDHARPIRCAAGVVVAPAWLDVDGDPEIGERDLVVRIEPGASFGLGDHPTTRSSVRALAEELDRRRARGDRLGALLDVGCGTGVLGILGARRGAPRVRAVDISAAAVTATIDNARRNVVEHLIDADTTPVADLAVPEPDGYDVIVANILAPTLVLLAPDLRRLLAPTGTLIVSGVLAADHGHGHAHVLEALAPLVHRATIDDAGWATITLGW